MTRISKAKFKIFLHTNHSICEGSFGVFRVQRVSALPFRYCATGRHIAHSNTEIFANSEYKQKMNNNNNNNINPRMIYIDLCVALLKTHCGKTIRNWNFSDTCVRRNCATCPGETDEKFNKPRFMWPRKFGANYCNKNRRLRPRTPYFIRTKYK